MSSIPGAGFGTAASGPAAGFEYTKNISHQLSNSEVVFDSTIHTSFDLAFAVSDPLYYSHVFVDTAENGPRKRHLPAGL